MPATKRLNEQFYFDAKTRVYDQLNRLLFAVEDRIAGLEQIKTQLGTAVDQITEVALSRLDETFTPLILDAQERLAKFGANFSAQSVTPLTIGLGARILSLLPDQKDGYVYADYVAIRHRGGDEFMIATVDSYDRTEGQLFVTVIDSTGTGTFADWDLRMTVPPDLTHANRTDNPHQTTAAQVGAYTIQETIDEINALNDVQSGVLTSTVQAQINQHSTRMDNPHGVTAAQTGAVKKSGDTMTGALTIGSNYPPSRNLTIDGSNIYISFNNGPLGEGFLIGKEASFGDRLCFYHASVGYTFQMQTNGDARFISGSNTFSPSTGALTVAGGLGVGLDIRSGQNICATGGYYQSVGAGVALLLNSVSGYTRLYESSGTPAIQCGPHGADSQNYYDNDGHNFRTYNGAAQLAKLNAGGLKVTIGSLATLFNSAALSVSCNTGAYTELCDGTHSTLIGADASGSHIGAFSNHPFSIRTNNVNRLYIDQSGASLNGSFQVAGDITANRGGGAGVYYFGSGPTKYLYYDGTNFNLTGGSLSIGAGLNVSGQSNLAGLNCGSIGCAGSLYFAADANVVSQSGYLVNQAQGNLYLRSATGSIQIADTTGNVNICPAGGTTTIGGASGPCTIAGNLACWSNISGYSLSVTDGGVGATGNLGGNYGVTVSNNNASNTASACVHFRNNANNDGFIFYSSSTYQLYGGANSLTLFNQAAAPINFCTGATYAGQVAGDRGLVWGNPTGGSKGNGSINAQFIYVNNNPVTTTPGPAMLTCFGIQYLKHGQVDLPQWDAISPTGKHDLAHRFVEMLADFDPRDPDQYIARMMRDEALPGMPTFDEWKGNEHQSPSELGEMHSRLWLAVEMLASAFVGTHKRLQALEAKG